MWRDNSHLRLQSLLSASRDQAHLPDESFIKILSRLGNKAILFLTCLSC